MNVPSFCNPHRVLIAASFIVLALGVKTGLAGSAQWNASPSSADWNTAANWTPGQVPNGAADVATFAGSNQTSVAISANTIVSGITFSSGKSAYTITAGPLFDLTISGNGVLNSSGIEQNFVTAVDSSGHSASINFTGSASAGSLTTFTNNGGTIQGSGHGETLFSGTTSAGNSTFVSHGGLAISTSGGATLFFDNSTAANGTFIIDGSAAEYSGGAATAFFDSSTAANGTFFVNGGTTYQTDGGQLAFSGNATADHGSFTLNGGTISSAGGGLIRFFDSSTAANGNFIVNPDTDGVLFYNSSSAGSATFTLNSGGVTFGDTSSAGNATLTIHGGRTSFLTNATAGNSNILGYGRSAIGFSQDATGGTASLHLDESAYCDISSHNFPGVTIGSLDGNGSVFLGSFNLTIGSNDLDTTFGGVIRDGGPSFSQNPEPSFSQDGGSSASQSGGSVTKIGAGALTLDGVNTYSGGTTVSSGELVISRSVAGGPFAIGANGQVTNNGTIGGDVFVTGILTGCGTIKGTLTVDFDGIVNVNGCGVTVNGAIANHGLFVLRGGATLSGTSPSFTNYRTLDISTAGSFAPTGFTNDGTLITSSVIKSKAVQKIGNALTLTIDSYTGHTYQLQKSVTPDAAGFANLGSVRQGSTGTTLTFTDSNVTGARGFYRIAVDP